MDSVVQYSAVCETDVVAYQAYLRSFNLAVLSACGWSSSVDCGDVSSGPDARLRRERVCAAIVGGSEALGALDWGTCGSCLGRISGGGSGVDIGGRRLGHDRSFENAVESESCVGSLNESKDGVCAANEVGGGVVGSDSSGADTGEILAGDSPADQVACDLGQNVRLPLGSREFVTDSLESEKNGAGPNVERNRVWRAERKQKKKKRKEAQGHASQARVNLVRDTPVDQGGDRRRSFATCGVGCGEFDGVYKCLGGKDSALCQSIRKKWASKNALEAAKAERELKILEAVDIDEEIRKRRAQLLAASERSKVSIEVAHAKLKGSGNLTDDDQSRIHTVFSGSGVSTDIDGNVSGSISPNSSASMAEFRRLEKLSKDLEFELNAMKVKEKQVESFLTKRRISYEHIDKYDKQSDWSDTPANYKILDDMYPDGFATQGSYNPGYMEVIGEGF